MANQDSAFEKIERQKNFRKLFFNSGIYSFINNSKDSQQKFSMRDKREKIFGIYGNLVPDFFGKILKFNIKNIYKKSWSTF